MTGMDGPCGEAEKTKRPLEAHGFEGAFVPASFRSSSSHAATSGEPDDDDDDEDDEQRMAGAPTLTARFS